MGIIPLVYMIRMLREEKKGVQKCADSLPPPSPPQHTRHYTPPLQTFLLTPAGRQYYHKLSHYLSLYRMMPGVHTPSLAKLLFPIGAGWGWRGPALQTTTLHG